MASTPPRRLRQYVSRSAAPGSSTAIPTMATGTCRPVSSSVMSPARGGVGDGPYGRVAPGEFAEQGGGALLGVDELDAAPGVLPAEFGAHHAGVAAGGCPGAPVDGDGAVAGAGGPVG